MAKKPVVFPDKKKYIYLYCRTLEERNRYERLSKEAGISLNKFLLNAIEIGLNPPAQPVSDDVITLSEELNQTRDELRIARILIKRYQEELQKAKESVPTLQLDRDLLDLFRREKKPLSEDDIIKCLPNESWHLWTTHVISDNLTIEPNSDKLTDIGLQIESMERLGLIKKVGKGWVWNG